MIELRFLVASYDVIDNLIGTQSSNLLLRLFKFTVDSSIAQVRKRAILYYTIAPLNTVVCISVSQSCVLCKYIYLMLICTFK